MQQQEFVVLDVETTGLSPWGGDRIVEIAALKIKNLKPVSQFYSLINPQREISWGAFQVNGISQMMVEGSPLAAEVLPAFLEFLGECHLIGHNIQFDLGFLASELALLGLNLNEDLVTLDTMSMARRIIPGLSSYSLSNLALSLDIEITQQHRAMADVYLTFEIFRRLLAKTTKTILPVRSAKERL